MTEQAISPLRRRMIEDMTIRKLGKRCGGGYGDLPTGSDVLKARATDAITAKCGSAGR